MTVDLVIRMPYGPHDPRSYATPTVGKQMTKQNFKDECDINKLLERFRKAGLVDQVLAQPQQYADCSGLVDYHEALSIVQDARALFATLPSTLRAEFLNDAGAFVEYASNPENEADMRELGLLPKVAPEVPKEAPVEPVEAPGEPPPDAAAE